MSHSLDEFLGTIHQGDCVAGMQRLPDESVDLIFADPPFNIGYEYDEYDDRLEDEHYLDWSRQWIAQVHRVLKANGTFWLAIGDEYAAELKIEAQKIGFHCRSWVIWYYTFGVNCKLKFTRSHAHLFHFVKDPSDFVFNHEDLKLRVPSARYLIYKDKRANPKGRLPDDTWILRPQDVRGGFSPEQDTWFISRVAGTFKERAGFHGCQMPEQLLGRIIRTSSAEGDVVVDPFSGSSTTLAVAKKMGREFFGFELSEDYVKQGTERLAHIEVGDRLNGEDEPNMVNVAQGKSYVSKPIKRKRKVKIDPAQQTLMFAAEPKLEEQREALMAAFRSAAAGYSLQRAILDPYLNRDFQLRCDRLGIEGAPHERNRYLLAMRQAGDFANETITKLTQLKLDDVRRFMFASEIAWRLLDLQFDVDLETLFCDPELAAQFDRIASELTPGITPFECRWATLIVREQMESQHLEASEVRDGKEVEALVDALKANPVPVDSIDVALLSEESGCLAIFDEEGRILFVDQARNLRSKFKNMLGEPSQRAFWQQRAGAISVRLVAWSPVDAKLKSDLIQKMTPRWNQVHALAQA